MRSASGSAGARHLGRLPAQVRQVARRSARRAARCRCRSRARAAGGELARSTSRIGPLLRSQASESGQHGSESATMRRMQAIDLLLTRRSARTLTEPAPDAAALELMFASAARAPDHGRLRPWRFVRDRGAARGASARCWRAPARAPSPVRPQSRCSASAHKALRAPLIVVVAAHVSAGVEDPGGRAAAPRAPRPRKPCMLGRVALGFSAMWKTGRPPTTRGAGGAGLRRRTTPSSASSTWAPRRRPSARPPREWRDLVRDGSRC